MRFPIHNHPTHIPIERPREDQPLPPVHKMAANALKATARAARAAVTGNPVTVPESVRDERWAICVTCRPWFRNVDSRCAHPECGCYLRRNVVSKISIATQECPIGKWKQWKP